MLNNALLIALLLSFWAGLYLVVKQQGRILLRLDQLEPAQPKDDEQARLAQARVGTSFPEFMLPDLGRKMVSIEDFRGLKALLVYWSPACGFCDFLAPMLAGMEEDFQKYSLQLVLLASGTAEANRELAEEHGLKCPILLLRDGESPAYFENLGTPSAYLVDEEGRVARSVVVGADAILALARELVSPTPSSTQTGTQPAPVLDVERKPLRRRLVHERPLSESRIERNGLRAGVPAPTFRLPDLDGRMVALEDYRGRPVLLVFSDPHCGPCDEFAPRLARLHRKHGDDRLALILIGRGEVEENRRKAGQFGIKFPVVVQDKWRLSKQYGIFATPVAFLVGEDGAIARDVAIGPDAILALAEEGLARKQLMSPVGGAKA